MKKCLSLLLLSLFGVLLLAPSMSGQSITSGDISGTITDSTGAAIPGAVVTVTSAGTGAKQTVKTSGSGSYRVSLLKPGKYHILVVAPGFSQEATDIDLAAGVVAPGDMKLSVGSNSTTVEVTETAPLLHTESAEISTEFDQEQISALPNPGNDLTFIAQTTPGAVMNTQGGYGNFASFGLPATANTFTVDGSYENDPFLNVNNSGATNLLLGNNDVATVTVLSNAYGAQYGGLGGTQVNETTRSGTNHFHGDMTYQWNGSVLNANDYFNNQQGLKKPRSNANQWSGAIGGPIFKDKTFFFFNTEGLRVVIPVRGTVYAPSASYIATTVGNAAKISPAAVAFYKNFFTSYTANAHYAAAIADANDPDAVIFGSQSSNFAHEAQYTGRIDHKIGEKDNIFLHATVDEGTQPTFTSLLNPLFNTSSPQPQYGGQLNETHVFTPNLANQFVFAELYYRAIFQNTNATAANAISPFGILFLDGDLANNGFAENPGGEDFVFPQGRAVNGYQFIDDVSYTKGKHTLKAGFYMRRDDVTDYGPQVETTPLIESTEETFAGQESLFGYPTTSNIPSADVYVAQAPSRLTQPVAVYNMGMYLQDEWKPSSQVVITVGMRFEHNSDPVCRTNCFAALTNNFQALATSTATPYSNAAGNGLINSGQAKAFSNFQKIGYEPRFGFAYTPSSLGSKTVFRGGFGFFADAFPAQVADDLLNNAPTNVGFTLLSPLVSGAGSTFSPLYGPATGSYANQVTTSAAAFRSAYAAGGSLNSISASVPAFSAPNFLSPSPKIDYPTYEEFNLAVEQQIGKSTTVGIDYVGNHTYHQPVLNNSVNAFNGSGNSKLFTGIPAAPPNQNFAQVTQIYSAANSNYNGVVLTATKRSSYLTLQFNYTYSHALDEISNGGFDGFSSNSVSPINPNPALLRQNYGNADYDTRNYISGNYVFTLPYYGGPRALTKGWEIAGDAFHSSGLPFTFTDTTTASTDLGYYGGALPAQQLTKHVPTKCSSIYVTGATTQNNCAASKDFGPATQFGQQARNQIFGPSYTDTDLSVYKSFDVPHYETAHLKLGVQFFNILNHPNFAQPSHDIADGSALGTTSGTVNPPTSILGSFLGGDASPRLIQLKANVNF